jgi:hypothetical protein
VGKYSHLKGQLEQISPEDRYDNPDEGVDGKDFAQKVHAAKDTLINCTLVELAQHYKKAKADKKAAEELVQPHSIRMAACEMLMLQLMENQQLSSFKLEAGGNFIVNDVPSVKVLDKAANREWFEAHNMKEMLSVNASTLKAMVAGILLDPIDKITGQPKALPDGIDIKMRSSIQLRKK